MEIEYGNEVAKVIGGRLSIDTRTDFQRISEDDAEAYSWTSVSADIDTGDTALLVCNNSNTKKLHIEKVYCWTDVAAQFKIHVPAYPTLAGTAVTGVNLNRGSTNEANGVAYTDETGNTFAAGNVITTIRNNEVGTDQFGEWVEYGGAVILAYHDCIAIDIIGEGAAFECTVIGYYK